MLPLNGSAQEKKVLLQQQTNKLDSLQQSLELTTDSLTVAKLCHEIYRHMAYDMLIKSPNEGSYLIRALRIYEKNEMWKDAGDVNRELGGIYFNTKQLREARNYWDLAINQYIKSNNLEGKVAVITNLAATYIYDSSTFAQNKLKIYLDSAIAVGQQLDDSVLLIWPFLYLGEWYNKKHDANAAEKYTQLATSLAESVGDNRSAQSGVYQLGMIKKRQGDTKEAIRLIEKSFSYNGIRKTSPGHLDAIYALSELYSAMGDFKKAYSYLTSYKFYKDTLFLEQHAKALLDLEIAYETDKKEQEIREKNGDIALMAEQAKVKNQWLLFGSIGLVVTFVIISLLRSRGHLKKQKMFQEIFSQDLIKAQEGERTRIAKELHDSVGQQLTLIKKKAQKNNQQDFSVLTNTALEEVRSISRALYPATLKQIGISESIAQLLYDLDEEVDMFFSVDIDDINNLLDEEKTLNLYRFIQESVNNVIKHAKAQTLSVQVSKGAEMIEVLVEDNGCGFENVSTLLSKSFGLKTMKERVRILNGTLFIQSSPGAGTKVTAKIPL